MNHADLRPVTVGDDQLIVLFNQVSQYFGGFSDGIPLLQRGVTENCTVTEGNNNSCFAHIQIVLSEELIHAVYAEIIAEPDVFVYRFETDSDIIASESYSGGREWQISGRVQRN